MGQFQAGQGDAGKHLWGRVLRSKRLNFQASARGGKLLLPSLSGKHANFLGALLRSGGWAASGKIPL